MMRTSAAALLAVCLSAVAASAQTNEDVKWALGEVAGELQLCSVYFLVITSCMTDQRQDLAHTYQEAAQRLIDLAVSSGRAAGVSDEAYVAQNSLYGAAMWKAMPSCTNIAVLLQRYSNFCQRLSHDADPRLKEWIACVRARQQTCGGPGLP
jgi:hypothetical protein